MTVYWTIPMNAKRGTYRIRFQGVKKRNKGKLSSYEGISNCFIIDKCGGWFVRDYVRRYQMTSTKNKKRVDYFHDECPHFGSIFCIMSSVIDLIRRRNFLLNTNLTSEERLTNCADENNVIQQFCFKKTMLKSPGKVSRLQVREGKRNDGSKIALVSLISEKEKKKCIQVPKNTSTSTSTLDQNPNPGRGWGHKALQDELKLKLRHEASLNAKLNDDSASYETMSEASFKCHKFDKLDDVSLVVTHYEDPCSFWAQDCDDADDVLEIEHILEKSRQEIATKEKLREDELYVVSNAEDGKSYRCRIIQILTDKEYIDFGNTEVVYRNQFLNTPTELLNYLPMAKLYRLYRVKPLKGLKAKAMHKEGIAFLKKIFSNDLVYGKVFKSVKRDFIPIKIRIDGLDLGEELIGRNYASPASYLKSSPSSPPLKDILEATEADTSDKTIFSESFPSFASDDFPEADEVIKESNGSSPQESAITELQIPNAKPQVIEVVSLQQRIIELESLNTNLLTERNGALTEVNLLKTQLIECDNKKKTTIAVPQKPSHAQKDGAVSQRENLHFHQDKINPHQHASLQQFEIAPQPQRKSMQSQVSAVNRQLNSRHDDMRHDAQKGGNFLTQVLKGLMMESSIPMYTDVHLCTLQLNSLLALIHQVRLLRKQIPFKMDQVDPIENICLFIQKHLDRINLEDIIEMLGINKASNDYNKAQQAISVCTHKGELPPLTVIRDAARITLHNAISQFVTEICSTTLDARLKDLLALRKLIGDLYGGYLKVKTPSSPKLEVLMADYKEWKEKHKETFINARLETNAHHAALIDTWNSIQQSLSWSSDVDPQSCSHNNLSIQMQNLKDALLKEMENCSVEKIGGHATLAMIVQKLNAEIEDEGAQIQAIKKQQVEYSQMIAVLAPWLDKMPNFTPLMHFDQEIKSLKSQLRHKLADLNDLEEEPQPDTTVLKQMRKELSAIRNQLHVAFATGDRLSAKFVQLSKVHYPELPLLYPSLDHEILNPNIVKEGRELIYYDVEPLHMVDGHITLYKTRILDKDFTLKEVILDHISMSEFVHRVSNYASVVSKQLVPITAILSPKDKRKLYLQMPYYEYSLLERNNTSTLPLEAKCKVFISLAKALTKLHAHNIIHGALHPKNVLISDDEAFLAPYDFATNLYQRAAAALKAPPVNGLTFLAPELISNRKQFSTSVDMYSLGCIALNLFYPMTLFENDKFKTPDYSGLEASETHFLQFISKLLDKDPEKRTTADQVACSHELQNPCTIFKTTVVLEPVVCDRLMTPLFVFTDDERRDVTNCVSRFSITDNDNDNEIGSATQEIDDENFEH
uniref:Protein kinase domain-containing protein n=1 Tax=Strigamia maritima TaxID=126957 RepID=T1JJL7_STRMM